jgi:hypothetical protein
VTIHIPQGYGCVYGKGERPWTKVGKRSREVPRKIYESRIEALDKCDKQTSSQDLPPQQKPFVIVLEGEIREKGSPISASV